MRFRRTELTTSRRKVISKSQWKEELQKSQLTWCCTPGCDCERDDQAAALGKNLHDCEVFPGTLHGPDGISKFVENREIGPLEETGRCPEEGDQKLQGKCAAISDVEVVCLLYYSSPGKGTRA